MSLLIKIDYFAETDEWVLNSVAASEKLTPIGSDVHYAEHHRRLEILNAEGDVIHFRGVKEDSTRPRPSCVFDNAGNPIGEPLDLPKRDGQICMFVHEFETAVQGRLYEMVDEVCVAVLTFNL